MSSQWIAHSFPLTVVVATAAATFVRRKRFASCVQFIIHFMQLHSDWTMELAVRGRFLIERRPTNLSLEISIIFPKTNFNSFLFLGILSFFPFLWAHFWSIQYFVANSAFFNRMNDAKMELREPETHFCSKKAPILLEKLPISIKNCQWA